MASWLPFTLPATIQKRFLSYALSKIGVFDNASLDLDNLNLTWGRQNVVELKDVGLDVAAITKKAGLGSSIMIESGKVRLLRLTVPADIHKSSIVIDAVGVDVSLAYQEEAAEQEYAKRDVRIPPTRSPAHRKTARRISSPEEGRRARTSRYDDEALPSVQDLARSFLMDEPAEERRRLEASVALHTASLDDSIVSESSQSTEPGTGASLGVPAFLASFLNGVLDRVVVNVSDVCVAVAVRSASSTSYALSFQLSVHEARIWSSAEQSTIAGESSASTRSAKLTGIRFDLVDDIKDNAASPPASQTVPSPADSRHFGSDGTHDLEDDDNIHQQTFSSPGIRSPDHSSVLPAIHASQRSIRTADSDRFADAHEAEYSASVEDSQFDIRPGDDNLSWGSRRERDGPSSQDLWESIADDNDLPDSLLFDSKQVTSTSNTQIQPPRLLNQNTPRMLPQSYTAASAFPAPGSVQSQSSLGAQHGPGSWPAPLQSHATWAQHTTAESTQSVPSTIDDEQPSVNTGPAPQDEPVRETVLSSEGQLLTESRVSMHGEAESMYMSALTEGSKHGTKHSELDMPGAWGAQSHSDHFEEHLALPLASTSDSVLSTDDTAHATPRAQTPQPGERERIAAVRAVKYHARTLLQLDEMVLALKLQAAPTMNVSQAERQPVGAAALGAVVSSYSERSLPRQESLMSTFLEDFDGAAVSAPSSSSIAACQLEIMINSILVELDLGIVQTLSQASKIFRKPGALITKQTNTDTTSNNPDRRVELKMRSVKLELVDEVKAVSASKSTVSPSHQLLSLSFSNSCFQHNSVDTRMQLKQFRTYIGTTLVMYFEPEMPALSNTPRPEIELAYSIQRVDVNKRTVPEITINGQVLRINVDLPAITQVSEYLGGLSGILELGSSLLSDHVTSPSPTTSRRPSTGVRFKDEYLLEDDPVSIKANARLAGLGIDIIGQSCTLGIRTSSVKAIHREQGVSLSTATIAIGKSLAHLLEKQNFLTIDNIRLDFLNTPSDKDLEKFLALLTPSNDKYDNDDDILLDTLLRQRKKGACMRVQMDGANLHIVDWQDVLQLRNLGADLAQLSVVAKYLPEDDRPGLLTMLRLKDCKANLPVNPNFGTSCIRFQDLQCAHIGLPSLIAIAFSNLNVTDHNGRVLIHSLLPLSGADNLPAIMVRMLGDEYEPSVKIKLYNVCVEYSVPVLLTLTGDTEASDAEQLLTGIANSVADLMMSQTTQDVVVTASQEDTARIKKQTKIDVLVRSSAIGLSPENLRSKALFVLSDSKISTIAPAMESTEVILELRRAALFVIDDATSTKEHNDKYRAGMNTTTDSRIAQSLTRSGYASVASIMSAKVAVKIREAAMGKAIEVDVHNELMLLETCADSTQTLIATLSALSPPTAPSKRPKYLVEPMSLEHMMSSFTGEPVAATESTPDMLFDADDQTALGTEIAIESSQLNEFAADDLLLESEMTSSLYGPVSSLIGDLDEDGTETDRPNAEAEESLLEEDPFVMTTTPDDLPFSDSTLMKDLRQQAKPAITDDVVDLEMLDIEDLGFDALRPSQHILGDHRRFNAPVSSGGKPKTNSSRCPVQVRMRDVHFIWNLHDGYDWQKTRDGIVSAVEQVELKTEERLARRRQSRNMLEEEESVIGDFLFNSIYIGVPSAQEAQDIRRQINRHIDDLASETESVPYSGISRPTVYSASGRPITNRARRRLKLERSRSHKIAFELKGLSVDFLMYPPDSAELQSSVEVRLQSFEIFDNVPTSTWKKFLTILQVPGGREMARPMVHLELFNVKTLQDYAATEMMVHASLLPLRLHVDQDALDFITRFFEFKDDNKAKASEPADLPFLQRVEVDTVDLQLDYKPKKVDYAGLRSGHTTEFMNFIVLDAANIRLKHAIVYGIKGFEPLHKTLNDVWMPDVQRNQLPTVLAGLAPVRSLVNISTGVRDVVAIPIREYKKDGRIVRSIQKGAYQFGKTTASELARFGAKVAIGTQNILSGAEELLAPSTASPSGNRPSPSHRISSDYGWHEVEEDDGDREKRAISAYADQPLGVLAGLQSARRYLEHDLLTAKDALIAVQGEVMSSNNAGAAAVAVARHAPTVILRPVIGASRAVGTALLGVGNQIDREHLRRMDDKYKRR